ncbi:hypothetical protein [Nonomuraea aurantiaca]|uniref:hypothetical protein n=1 Tax=Nonomuraea aurantiaca TaxID=2878562 RepID=UPI001CDA4C7C|nr:hypothetical protein [Nonomuraea aurantiaca]MCA2229328.1 hypothetical protein [Nonomuraea aurantiaca]
MYPGRIRWVEVVEQALAVIAAYEGGVTLRQCFYRLAVAGVIPIFWARMLCRVTLH